jgi:hypothetical protein
MMNNRNNAMEEMMTQAEYIEAAFKAYFPTSEVAVDVGIGERRDRLRAEVLKILRGEV